MATDERPSLDFSGVQSLLDRLGTEEDELCVVSLVAATIDGEPTLVFGSALFGPIELSQRSWPQWAALTHQTSAYQAEQWETAGHDLLQWREFAVEQDGWHLCRGVLDIANVTPWLTDLLAGRTVAGPGGGPPLRARPRAATALIHTFPLLAGPAGLLMMSAHRPALGYRFPIDTQVDPISAPSTWHLDGWRLRDAPLWLTGLPVSDPPMRTNTGGTATPGLFVGRLQRRAWIADIRTDPDGGICSVRLDHEPARINLADLEIELEEYADGDLVAARRIRLGDLQIPPAAPGAAVPVDLPTVGPALHRRLRLVDRDGLLLDATDWMPTVEQITVGVTVGDSAGSPQTTITVGHTAPVTLLERLTQSDRVETEYRRLLEAGLPGRIIDDPTTGLHRLTELLSAARSHLDILDPYFGRDSLDWSVLNQVTVPVRVLAWHKTNQKRTSAPAPAHAAPLTSLEFRAWHGQIAPWHDRVYLWDGGGLAVGTSPNKLGNRLTRIDRFPAAEASGWQQHMNRWWIAHEAVRI